MPSIPRDVLTVRVRKGMKRQLAQLAKLETRTVSNLVEILLDAAIQSHIQRQSQKEQAA